MKTINMDEVFDDVTLKKTTESNEKIMLTFSGYGDDAFDNGKLFAEELSRTVSASFFDGFLLELKRIETSGFGQFKAIN